jgi:cytochrome bd-type quinol oxidase subunit 2
MIKPCISIFLVASAFAATTWCCFGAITIAAWPVAVATSNGDLAWSAAMLLVAFAFLRIARKPRKTSAR